MNKNDIFEERTEPLNVPGKKPGHTPSLVVGILSIVFALLFALVGDVLGIVGIIMAACKRKTHNTKAGLICSIVGLALAIGNHVLAVLMAMALVA